MRAPSTATEDAPRLLPLLGWFTAALFFFYAWVMRVAPSVMVEELMRDFAVGAAVLGNLSAAYFYGYAGMQIPVGLLLDRFGPRRLIAIAALACAGGCALFALGTTLAAVIAGRFLIGASAAFSLVGAMAVAGQWFPANRFAILSGGAMAMGMAGGVFGQAPLRLAVEATDWRTANLLLALGGVGLAVAAIATIRDRWRGSGGMKDVLSGLGIVARSRQCWLIALAGLGTSAPLLGFAGLWGVPFLVTALWAAAHHGRERDVGAVRRLGRRRASVRLAVGSHRPPQDAAVGRPRPPVHRHGAADLHAGPVRRSARRAVLPGWLPGLGADRVLCAGRENHPPQLSGTAIGFVNMMVTGAGALFQPLVGFLLDLAWSGEIALGARVYDTGAYRLALTSLLVSSLAGLLCLAFVRETYLPASEA